MKIRITEIECNSDELRHSNTIADAFTNMLRRAFTAYDSTVEDDDEGEGGQDE